MIVSKAKLERQLLLGPLLAAIVAIGCSSSNTGSVQGNGGSPDTATLVGSGGARSAGTGGTGASGGATQSGGTTAPGGATSSGGVATSAGGTTASGGMVGGEGGAITAGGSATGVGGAAGRGSGGVAITGGAATGGSAAKGGSIAASGGAGGVGSTGLSGSDGGPIAIDWTPWTIQLPDGSGQRSLSSYTSAWFYPDGAYQAFMDPQTGKTTPGSKHPRSELHESSKWTSSGTNTLTVTGRVTKSGPGPICIGQVFCNDGDNGGHTLVELGYQTSGFSVYIEEGGTDPTSNRKLGGAIGLNSPFSYKLEFSGGKLTITANGQTLTYTPSAAAQSGHFYFKCGDYDQSATSGAVSTTPYSIFEASEISISHK